MAEEGLTGPGDEIPTVYRGSIGQAVGGLVAGVFQWLIGWKRNSNGQGGALGSGGGRSGYKTVRK